MVNLTEPRAHIPILDLLQSVVNQLVHTTKRMTDLIVAGIPSLVLLSSSVAISSIALPHSIQTAHFIGNWTKIADEAYKYTM